MQVNTNTDLVGGMAVLAFCGVFYSQMSGEFSPYGLMFPQYILPILVVIGGGLVARGAVKREASRKLCFEINWSMWLVIAVGAAWALSLTFLGFILAGSLALSILTLAFLPKEKANVPNVAGNVAGSIAGVLFMYFVFTRLLGVTLPVGILVEKFF